MSDLAVPLERLRCPQEPAAFIRYRVWCDHKLADAARDANGEKLVGVRRMGTPVDAQSEILLSIWRCAPDRVRVEHKGGIQHGAIGIGVGERWWSWSPRQGARSSDQYPPGASWLGQGYQNFLDPTDLLDALRVEPSARGTRAGPPVLIADAWPCGTVPRHPSRNRLGAYADRCRVEVDAERGLILSHQCFLGEELYQTTDAVDLQLDRPLDMRLFDIDRSTEA